MFLLSGCCESDDSNSDSGNHSNHTNNNDNHSFLKLGRGDYRVQQFSGREAWGLINCGLNLLREAI